MSEPEKSVVLLGATGAVGGEVLSALLASPAFGRVTALGRRSVSGVASPKLAQQVVDIGNPATYEPLLAGHQTAICTLGVGEPSKMSREEFRRIDFDFVLDFARACKRQGVSHFSLLSSVGAKATSSVFYLRSKGELEAAITAVGFDRVSFFRPSMILTPTNRYGISQAIILKVWPVIGPLLRGPLRPYRGILVQDLGRAIAKNAEVAGRNAGAGPRVEVLTWRDFKRMPG